MGCYNRDQHLPAANLSAQSFSRPLLVTYHNYKNIMQGENYLSTFIQSLHSPINAEIFG